MTATSINARLFDAQTASDTEWAALNAFENRRKAEFNPQDAPRRIERTKLDLQVKVPFQDGYLWIVWGSDRAEIITSASLQVWSQGSNEHLANYYAYVLPEFRRRGLARHLLGPAVDVARNHNRRLLISNTDSVVPSGEAFMRRLGARWGSTETVSRLALAEVDRGLTQAWQQRAAERAFGYELGLWDGPYPEAELEAVAAMMKVMNTAPRDDLEMEDDSFNPEVIWQTEAFKAVRKVGRWTFYARHMETGRLAGYTELFLDPYQPDLPDQGDTGVLPEHRNLGIGRWVKAAMIDKVLHELPEARFIQTGNAESNEPMLRINRELGFKPHRTLTVWQLDVDRAAEYIDLRAAA